MMFLKISIIVFDAQVIYTLICLKQGHAIKLYSEVGDITSGFGQLVSKIWLILQTYVRRIDYIKTLQACITDIW